jgi:hypothetical protein
MLSGVKLKVVWAKFSTLSLAVFVMNVIMWHAQERPHLELKPRRMFCPLSLSQSILSGFIYIYIYTLQFCQAVNGMKYFFLQESKLERFVHGKFLSKASQPSPRAYCYLALGYTTQNRLAWYIFLGRGIYLNGARSKLLEPYSQHFIFFATYEWVQ